MNESITPLFETLINRASNHIKTILSDVFTHTNDQKAVVVYDTNSLLSQIMTSAYKNALPDAIFIDFNEHTPAQILHILSTLEAFDLVALIQSGNFRLDAFRIRVELFKRQIKVIEHPHLGRMSDDEAPFYVDSMAYDKDYFRGVGKALKSKIDKASRGVLDSGGELLVYDCPFESAKLNVGDYACMLNTGGQFPIGEVFTEAKDLRALHGRVKIFIFSDTSYKINRPTIPVTLIIKEGQVVGCENSSPQFDEIIELIREGENGVVWVRELGFGLNKAFTTTRTVSDTGTYERMCGVHLSLGAKHGMYAKEGFKRGDGKFHIDVFADTKSFTLDDEVIYKEGAWIV